MRPASLPPSVLACSSALLLAVPSLVPAQGTPPPGPWAPAFTPSPDGWPRVQFTTEQGWLYLVEGSPDLTSFACETGGAFYGSGHSALFTDASQAQASALQIPLTIYICNEPGVDAAICVRPPTAGHAGWSLPLSAPLPQHARSFVVPHLAGPQLWHFTITSQLVPAAALPALPPDPSWPSPSLAERTAMESHMTQLIGALAAPILPAPLPASSRRFYRVRPIAVDSNDNGLFDWFERSMATSPFYAAADPRAPQPTADPDSDGLTNLQEQSLGLQGNAADSDHDGLLDGFEAASASSTPPTDPPTPPATGLQVFTPAR